MAKKQKQLTVEWTETAEMQFFEILEYWTERNKSTRFAEKLTAAVWQRTNQISRDPYSSKRTSFPETRKAAWVTSAYSTKLPKLTSLLLHSGTIDKTRASWLNC